VTANLTDRRALPFPDDADWHWRWIQFAGAGATILHRVLSYVLVDAEWVQIHDVETACGMRIKRTGMPGLLSGLGAPRCKVCCRRLGIPAGDGAPYNAEPKIVEPREVPG